MDPNELLRPPLGRPQNVLGGPWTVTFFVLGVYALVGLCVFIHQCRKRCLQRKVSPEQQSEDVEAAIITVEPSILEPINPNITIIYERRMSDVLPRSTM